MAENIPASLSASTIISTYQSSSTEKIDDEVIASGYFVGDSLYDKIKRKRRRCTTGTTITENASASYRSSSSPAPLIYKGGRSTNERKSRVEIRTKVAKTKVVYEVCCKAEGAGSSIRNASSQKKHQIKEKKTASGTSIPRRSSRGNSSLLTLATAISDNQHILFITGAGLSVNSGIQPFRGDNGVWNEVLWTNATRDAFRQNPLQWYNEFWLKYFPPNYDNYRPNHGHEALSELASIAIDIGHHSRSHNEKESINNKNNVRIITQNVDGLHCRTHRPWNYQEKLIEAHGRVGLYKCIPEQDSDTDSDSTDEENENDNYHRPVKLGSLRKHRGAQDRLRVGATPSPTSSSTSANDASSAIAAEQQKETENAMQKLSICPYEITESIRASQFQSTAVRNTLTEVAQSTAEASSDYNEDESVRLEEPPKCPGCRRPCLPQSLLFDEGYHSHSFYQFQTMEKWIAQADILVFVGTSFSVTITDVALRHAMDHSVPVYNFNLHERLTANARLNVENIMGDSSETLTQLSTLVQDILDQRRI